MDLEQVRQQINEDFKTSGKVEIPEPTESDEKSIVEHIRPKWMADENSITLGQLLRELMDEDIQS